MTPKKTKSKTSDTEMVMEPMKKDDIDLGDEEKLDPAEEKMLDRILMGVVIFILAWLGLSIILVVLGYLGVWK